MKISKKIAVAAIPAVMALASTLVDSKNLVDESRRLGSFI